MRFSAFEPRFRRLLLAAAVLGLLVFAWMFSIQGEFEADGDTRAIVLSFPDTLGHPFPVAPIQLFRLSGEKALYLSSGPPELVARENVGRIWRLQDDPPALRSVPLDPGALRKGYEPLSNLLPEKKCGFGFEGSCDLNEVNLQIELSFAGVALQKPVYIAINLWGGRTGWQWKTVYFGKRILVFRELSTGNRFGRFVQDLWNESGYDDPTQVVWVEPVTRRILVLPNPHSYAGRFYLLNFPSRV